MVLLPGFVFKKGRIGVVSKSGALTYEIFAESSCGRQEWEYPPLSGIGGDPIIGTTTKDAVEMFMSDSETDGIIMIGRNWRSTRSYRRRSQMDKK